ncbi:MAG TPA: peroxidase family protein, partial [Isosphaeraceae bacterium]
MIPAPRWSHRAVRTASAHRPSPRLTPRIDALEDRCLLSADAFLKWNDVMVDAHVDDPTQASPEPVQESRVGNGRLVVLARQRAARIAAAAAGTSRAANAVTTHPSSRRSLRVVAKASQGMDTPRVPQQPGVRSIDGSGNNLANPAWGRAGTDLLRRAPAAYADGVSAPAGANRPSARVISNTIADQGDEDIISDRQLSAMIYAWGQFLDHDIDLTPTASPAASFNIPVPAGDPSFDPAGTGTRVVPLSRSLADPATGTSASNPLQQVNVVTAWIDGSQVYGSDAATAEKLRTHVGGRLKTSPGADGVIGTSDDLLPLNTSSFFTTGTLPMANDAHRVPDDALFAAGDVRANENIELTSLHTLFVREHNRLADALRRANPRLDDEAIYQMARAQVIGELQAITYNEWLPALLGPRALPAYRGYDPTVNPGIATEFSTAAFRFGHSQLGDDVEFLDDNGLPVVDEVPLSDAFFNPPLLTANGIDPILKYLASDPSSEVDPTVVTSVRDFLFGPPGSGGLDLASLNIQRGRDHGLADYNTIRAAYGLPRVTSFAQITADVAVQDKLRALYGTVDDIDAWVGALAEDHVAGGSTGPLIRAVLADQFARLRDGDRFWY